MHTDHLNLLYNKLPSQRMMRWRFLLEEYNQKVAHVARVNNDAADALSGLDLIYKAHNLNVYGAKTRRLEYVDVHMMNMCMFMSKSNFEEDSFNSDVGPINDIIRHTTRFVIRIRHLINAHSSAQLNDDSLMLMAEKCIV